jgi:hypothetical protein
MITARNLVDVKPSSDDATAKIEQERMAHLYTAMRELPMDVRSQVFQDLLVILGNQNEKLQQRIQAAVIIGYQTHVFNVVDSGRIGEFLFNVIKNELLLNNVRTAEHNLLEESPHACRTDDIRFLFFELLSHALYVIDYQKGLELNGLIPESVEGRRARIWLADLAKRARISD